MTDDGSPGFTVRAMVCDSAALAEDKLYVQGGGWLLVGADVFPTRLRRVGLAVLIGVARRHAGETHTLTVRLRDGDGREIPLFSRPPDQLDGDWLPVFESHTAFQFRPVPPPLVHDGRALPIALNFDGLVIERPNTFTFVLSIDGVDHEDATLQVVQMPPRP